MKLYPPARTKMLAILMIAALLLAGCAAEPADPTAAQSTAVSAQADMGNSGERENTMISDSLVVVVNGQEYSATLADTEAAREFAELLPLNLQMEELNGNEKYAYLDNPLSADSYNPGTINTGDIMLFGSSCIVLFYQTFPTQYTYTPLAYLDDAEGLAEIVGTGDVEARIAFA